MKGKDGSGKLYAAELSIKAVVVGIVLGVVFGAANAYLGLKVGLTVSASIPAAVMGMVFFRFFGGTLLESNMVQTIGSAGESLAAGVIFTIPAFFLWQYDPGRLRIFLIALLGGLLGVLLMVPLRAYLVAKEHDRLPFPEGTACAEVLESGGEGGTGASRLFTGLTVGGLYQLFSNGHLFGFWRQTVAIDARNKFHFGAELTPELLGIGYIIGPTIAALMFGGGCLGDLVLVPMIKLLGNSEIAAAGTASIRSDYVRLVGVGAVTAGGLTALVKALPVIVSSFKAGIAGFGKPRTNTALSGSLRQRGHSGIQGGTVRTGRTGLDLPMWIVAGGVIFLALVMAVLPHSLFPVGPVGAFLVVMFSFFFVTVSSRIVGLIGSSSNPVSGMTIATLLITAAIYLGLGEGADARFVVLTVGAVVCIAAAIAGDTSQDLKTGYLVKATPMFQEIGELTGVLASAAALAFVIYLFKGDIMSGELAAPQANMMKTVIDGVLTGNLQWDLIAAGGFIALVIELMGMPSLAFAVGLYLPIELSVPVLIGGLVRRGVDAYGKKAGKGTAPGSDTGVEGPANDGGVLYSSGLIAGASLAGVGITALVASGVWSVTIAGLVEKAGRIYQGLPAGGSIAVFGILTLSLVSAGIKGRSERVREG